MPLLKRFWICRSPFFLSLSFSLTLGHDFASNFSIWFSTQTTQSAFEITVLLRRDTEETHSPGRSHPEDRGSGELCSSGHSHLAFGLCRAFQWDGETELLEVDTADTQKENSGIKAWLRNYKTWQKLAHSKNSRRQTGVRSTAAGRQWPNYCLVRGRSEAILIQQNPPEEKFLGKPRAPLGNNRKTEKSCT